MNVLLFFYRLFESLLEIFMFWLQIFLGIFLMRFGFWDFNFCNSSNTLSIVLSYTFLYSSKTLLFYFFKLKLDFVLLLLIPWWSWKQLDWIFFYSISVGIYVFSLSFYLFLSNYSSNFSYTFLLCFVYLITV